MLRSSPFWLLSGAFVLAALATIAMTVFAIPFLLERGHSPAFAAFAVGLIGVSQIPGRVLFARLHAEPWNVFALIGLGVAVVVAFDSTAAVLIGLVLLGMGNGMATLSRATAIADLYGAAAYGTIASVAGGVNTAARAAGPFLAAVYATVVGYTGAVVDARRAGRGRRAASATRAERRRRRPPRRLGPGYRNRTSTRASAPPASCARMNGATDAGAIPANVSENTRPTVIAGFAKLVEDVNQYAAPM